MVPAGTVAKVLGPLAEAAVMPAQAVSVSAVAPVADAAATVIIAVSNPLLQVDVTV